MEGLYVFWLVFAICVGFAASHRGRSGWGWFFVAIILSPLLAVIVLALIPNLAVRGGGEVVSEKTHVRCPECRELVRADARLCKHCRTALIPQA